MTTSVEPAFYGRQQGVFAGMRRQTGDNPGQDIVGQASCLPFVTPDSDPIGANLSMGFEFARASSPCPLPPGERVFRIPSLDGRGHGEGDKILKSRIRFH